jgi:hypothetical protein
VVEAEPILDAPFVFALTGIEDQEVETALGVEELVGGVHDFLPAEVPDVQGDGNSALLGAIHLQRPGFDVNPVRLRFGFVKTLLHEPLNERGFAYSPLTDEDELGFVKWTGGFCLLLPQII